MISLPREMAGDKVADIGGRPVRIQVSGPEPGQPLLLINGLGGHLEMWRPLIAALGDRRTICFDAPGAGGSPAPWRPLSMRELAAVACGVLDAAGAGTADVLGVSLGGAIAQELAHRSAHRVSRLVLAATTCGWGAVPGHPVAVSHLANPFRYYAPRYFARIAPGMLGGRLRTDPDLVSRYVHERSTHPPTARGFLWQMLSGTGWSSLPWLAELTQPTLILTGDDDPLIRPINARILQAKIPNAELRIVPGGHLFILDSAAETAPLVTAFLDADTTRPGQHRP